MTDVATTPETQFESPWGSIELRRHPPSRQGTLRAWDAADAYALDDIADVDLPDGSRCLVIGDRFGAMCVALATGLPTASVRSMSDSWTAHEGLVANLARNGLAADRVRQIRSTETPEGPLELLVVRIPRSLALLEDQLRRVRVALTPSTVAIGAGMVRDVHTSTLDVIESVIGPTTTSMARRKARLIHTALDEAVDPGPPAFPVVHRDGSGVEVVSHAGVFAQGRLDPGTRLLLDHLPTVRAGEEVVDLGCGNGIVGLTIAARQPDARLTFTDDSHLALASAEEGWARARGEETASARFLIGDGMDPLADASVDLIVVNPPFHDDHATGDAVAWDMFTGSRRALRPGGRIVVVGNRHLGYHTKLKRIFGGCTTVASTPKFVVLTATRRGGRA